jgi:hypothetical protein
MGHPAMVTRSTDTTELVPPSPENENNLTDWLDSRLNQLVETQKFIVSSPEFHTDPYGAAKTLVEIILTGAVNSPNMGLGAEEDHLRGLLMHFSGQD